MTTALPSCTLVSTNPLPEVPVFNATTATEAPDLDAVADDLRTLAALLTSHRVVTVGDVDVPEVLQHLAVAVDTWHEAVSD